MAGWQQIEQEAVELAAEVRARVDAGTTAPRRLSRISAGAAFAEGEPVLGMLPDPMKLLDVRHDPAFARLPARTADDLAPAPVWRQALRMIVETPPSPGSSHAGHFRIDITEVLLTDVDDLAAHLVIEASGYRRRART